MNYFFYGKSKTQVPYKTGESVLESLNRAKIPIDQSCGGFATCGTCQIKILNNLVDIPKPESAEEELITERKFESNERLACQLRAQSNLWIDKTESVTQV